MTLFDRVVEGVLVGLGMACARVGSVVEEDAHDVGMAVPRCAPERGDGAPLESVHLRGVLGEERAQAGIEHRIDQLSGAVEVPGAKLHDARMRLAGQGLPKSRSVGMEMLAEKRPFGTSEPPGDSPSVRPDAIVVPVVAFDRRGGRLGYGRGYYDRAISAMRDAGQQPYLLGIAFSVQEVEAISVEPHDARLDWLATEKETLSFLPGGI